MTFFGGFFSYVLSNYCWVFSNQNISYYLVPTSAGACLNERLWLVDPLKGEVLMEKLKIFWTMASHEKQ